MTQVFPCLSGDRMTLKLSDKKDQLTSQDFKALACTIGLPQGDADEAIATLISCLANAVETIRLPTFAAAPEAAATIQRRAMALTKERFDELASSAD